MFKIEPAKADRLNSNENSGNAKKLSSSHSSQEALKAEIFNKLDTIQGITYKVLERNPVLRILRFRNLLSQVVSEIYGKEISNETVPRACRVIQNEMGFFKVEDTTELEKIYREYYSR